MNIEDVMKEKLKTYSEGNEYLYDALCKCWNNGIKTYDCCVGYDPHNLPYLSIIINEKSLSAIKNIIASLQDMKDITMEYKFRERKGNENISSKENKGFIIRGTLNNRCEMFYKIGEAVQNQQKYPKTKMNSEIFYRKLKEFYDIIGMETGKELEDAGTQDGIFSNDSEELKDYYKQVKKFRYNSFMRKLTDLFSEKARINNQKFERLKQKYETMQNEYIPTMKDRILQLHDNERNKIIKANEKYEQNIMVEEYNKSNNLDEKGD